ncbi:MAG: hypothetical protein ACXWJM_02420 [Ramlibacter sp.]
MSYRSIQMLVVVAAALFGAAFLLAPELITSFYGIHDWNSTTVVPARLYGVALLMVAGAAYACLPIEDLALQRRIALANIPTSALGALVGLQSVLAGTTNALMWTTVLIFGFFTAAWLMFRADAGHVATGRHAT